MGEIGDSLSRGNALADADAVQIHEERFAPLVNPANEDISRVHVAVLEAALMGSGNEAREGIDEQVRLMSIVPDRAPVVTEGNGIHDGLGDEERRSIESPTLFPGNGHRGNGGD
ncbi:MAG: hypothetical protein AMXMBFR20_23860 [Planctomycetia bacterium]